MEESPISIGAIEECLKPAVLLYPPVLADPQEYDPVYGILDGEVQFLYGEFRVSYGKVPGEAVTPGFYLLQEFLIYLTCPPLPFRRLNIAVKTPLEDRFP